AASDRHVPGQGVDPKEPARDRRAVWRARPHHGAARGAQDHQRPRQGHRTQPAAARAGADAQGLTPAPCVKKERGFGLFFVWTSNLAGDARRQSIVFRTSGTRNRTKIHPMRKAFELSRHNSVDKKRTSTRLSTALVRILKLLSVVPIEKP